ncbi:MAG: N-acetyltransferase [Phycisphaera sp.]|nr:N-acetyltransferase [Phycisphaera sp.]
MIRRASIPDIPAIGQIINDAAEYGLMLHRSWAYLYEHLRDFHVAVEEGQTVGVCGLNIVWANIAEVYSLVVAPSWRGKGLGRQLVLSCIDEAEELGIKRLMTLTYERVFFERLGFEVVDRQTLPLKVWSECVRCSKSEACDEIAMVRVIEDVVEQNAPKPPTPAPHEYEVPVVLGNTVRQEAAVFDPSVRREPMDEPQ